MKIQNLKIGKLKDDPIIWAIMIILCLFSIFAVYSTGSKLGDPYHRESLWFLLRSHVLYIILGIVLMFIMGNVNYRWIGRFSKIGLIAGFLLIVFTLFFGKEAGDAKRSLVVFGISFQTIQIAEVLFIIYFAQWISRAKDEINNFKKVLLPMLIYIAITCILIMSQKTSGGIILGITFVVLLFISQLKKKYFFSIVGTLLFVAIMGLTFIMNSNTKILRLDTARTRIESFIGSGEINKETIITEAAIARGGVLPSPGSSILMSSVGESYSDYIFAFIVEEYGILTGIFIILLYLGLFYRIKKSAIAAQSTFGSYLAIGLGFFITFQALTHILVCVGYFPATGETLPLISRGGMSIVTMSFCLGILLNISDEAKRARKELKKEKAENE
ncbi:MAG: FtsW/RodA/SpoVE family cell cycle protein [Bacteroidales bacterium]|jgi:cell division protein FtsW|nr:FtsW/RodA/SpoVE family cell cycle protein [Bacteroidales bacterium]